jgi:RNA polymerase sigma-70 factor (ECF subfamily)
LLEVDSEDISAEEQVLRRLDYADVGGALARIAPELRVVLQLTVLDGLSTREAAVLLGIPRGTVKTRLQRARAKMREEMA